MNATRTGILVFGAAVLAGPWYTVPEYHAVRHLISELAAQSTPGNWIMSAAFVALGVGLVADGVRRYRHDHLPFMAFGVLMALAGLFGHRPLDPNVSYQAWAHAAHSALATAAGFAITFALGWQALRQPRRVKRVLAGVLSVACVALPLAMLWLPPVQGAVQRLMYGLIFGWLWVHYPIRRPA